MDPSQTGGIGLVMPTQETPNIGRPTEKTPQFTDHVDLSPATTRILDQFGDRRRQLLLSRATAAAFLAFTAALTLIAICDYVWLLSTQMRSSLSVVAYLAAAFAFWFFGLRSYRNSDRRELAKQFESADPRLRGQMLSAVELADPETQNGSPSFRRYLQHRVGAKVGATSLKRLLPFSLIKRWIVTAIVVSCVVLLLMMVPPLQIGRRLARAALPGVQIQRASRTELTITEPSPPSRSVAQGDSVGVVVSVRGLTQSDDRSHSGVTLYWQTIDGDSGETEMIVRQAIRPGANSSDPLRKIDFSAANDSETAIIFAANLAVGKTPVFYQVTAGDAISLWNKLIPRPRPHVVSFRKTLVFPEYTRLPNSVEVAEHGDVTAVIGTAATIEATFDQQVTDAVVRYGSRGFEMPMQAVDDQGLRFVIKLPVNTPGQYQVDAVSPESGLSNPFSPQYSVTPQPDLPPTAMWATTMAPSRVVSPLQIVSLSATVTDDLPMDDVVHEWQVNSGPLVQRRVTVDESARRIDLQWEWDLLDANGDSDHDDEAPGSAGEHRRLRAGDIVRTRIVAVDRRSERGVSEMIEFLVTDEGFDTDRHERLDQISDLRRTLNAWFSRAIELAETQRLAIETGFGGTIDDEKMIADLPEAMTQILSKNATLRSELADMQQQIDSAMLSAKSSVEAGDLDLISASMYDATSRSEILARQISKATQKASAVNAETQKSSAVEVQRKRLLSDQRTLVTIANRGQSLSRSTLGLHLTAAIFRDLEALRSGVLKIIGPNVQMPPNRFNQHGLVIAARMDDLETLVGRHHAQIPESTQHRLDNWLSFVSRWRQDIQRLVDQPTKSSRWKEVLADFTVELRSQSRHNLLDGRLHPELIAANRDLARSINWPSKAMSTYLESLRETARTTQQIANSKDSAEALRLKTDLENRRSVEPFRLAAAMGILAETERLRRLSPYADPIFAADLNLARRAIEQVTERRAGIHGPGSLGDALDEITNALGTIEAANATRRYEQSLTDVISGERFSKDLAETVLSHSYWLERFSVGLQWSLQRLTAFGVPSVLIKQAEQTRNNSDFHEARQQIASRRWNSGTPVPADRLLIENQKQLADVIDKLTPIVQSARETLRKYVASLPEMARKAAQETKATAKAVADQENTRDETDRVAEQAARAADRIDETLQALADFASQADLNDQTNIELVRDADAAIKQINETKNITDQAIRESQAAVSRDDRVATSETAQASLEELATQLEQTANHFENAENGNDVSKSRQSLRPHTGDSPQSTNPSNQQTDDANGYEDPFSELLQANEDANQTAEQRLAELEQELKSNEPMREELDGIALQAAEAAQLNLAKAAREERQLAQTLERTDHGFMEQKRGLRSQLKGLADRVRVIAGAQDNADSLTRLTQQAADKMRATELTKQLRLHREALRLAADNARRIPEDATLVEIKQAIKQITATVEEAASTNKDVSPQARKLSGARSEKSDESADETKRASNEARVWQERTRDARKSGNETQAKSWEQVKRSSDKRLGQAQTRERSANNELQRAQSQEKRKPGSAKQRIIQAERKISDAKREAIVAKTESGRAKQLRDQASQRAKTIATEKIAVLDSERPLVDLITRSTAETGRELAEISDQLSTLADRAGIEQQLRSPANELAAQAGRQDRIRQTVSEASDLLQRAARHQQRLGQASSAAQLAKAADQITTQLDPVLSAAKIALNKASSAPELAPKANAQVDESRRKLEAVAADVRDLLNHLNESSESQAEIDATVAQQASQPAESQSSSQSGGDAPAPDGSAKPGSQQASGQPSREGEATETESRKMAQMLDELDRSINSQSQTEEQTAAEASAAAQAELQSQAQQAAQSRQQQISSSNSPTDQDQASSDPPTDPSTQSGGGEMPPGDSLSTDGTERIDSVWGQLRQQKSEDAIESRSSSVAPQYRREVQAYFEALARKAASRKPTKQRSRVK